MKPLSNDATDEALVEQAKKGDLDAYAEVVRRYRERLYHTIYRFTRSHSDTDDLVQDTFLRAFQELGRFRRKSAFYTWIYRIAVNLSLNFLKKRKRDLGREEYDDCRPEGKHPAASSPEFASMNLELSDKVNEAVEALPLPYRSSFILVAIQGMSHAEAAGVLNCAENTISWRMHKARKMLRTRLRPYFSEVPDEMP
jgi:RNA polymerase sigma-70 factor (ECF subfamily)